MIYHYNQVPVFYEIQGEGPVIVLLHGFLESSSIWSSIVPQLTSSKTVLMIDLPGHGKSDSLGPVHTMESMADVVSSLLRYLKISTVSLVGHSMGGYVALAMVEANEMDITQLILLNSTAVEDSPDRKLNRNRALKVIDQNKTAFIGMAITNLFSQDSRVKHGSEIERLKKEALEFSTKGITAAIRGMRDRKDRTSVLKNFRRKKKIVAGKDDPIVPLASSKALAEQTNSELIILDGGHMSWSENTDECVKILHLID